jgi:uncharacterized membrane-anchored protein YitT (DUF2179 family)
MKLMFLFLFCVKKYICTSQIPFNLFHFPFLYLCSNFSLFLFALRKINSRLSTSKKKKRMTQRNKDSIVPLEIALSHCILAFLELFHNFRDEENYDELR